MKQLFIICLLLLAIRCFAESKSPLLPASKRMKEAYVAWKKQPKSAVQQQLFIKAFPTTKKIFLAVFYPNDFGQLYDGHDYFVALDEISISRSAQVIQLCIGLGKTHPQGSDAISYLHETTVKLALAHPKLFASKLVSLTTAERRELFYFLADVEGIRHYPDYDLLIQRMIQNGYVAYAAELRQAKQWQLPQPMH
jgi:hypothetical protein